MFARSATIHARPGSIDAGIAYIRDEAMPTLMGTEGCIGLSLLVDRDSGRCISTIAWQTRQDREASTSQLQPIRDRTSEILGGAMTLDEWDIAVLHRDHTSRPGACVRVTWVRTEPDLIDRAVDVFRMGVLPRMEELDGFCSASLMLDREAGRGVSSVTFDSAEAMERSRGQARELRESGSREARVEVVEFAEFELALAHLRVPEMA